MGERKVVNKYYPADFDPAKVPRRRQPKNNQVSVRMMLPMSVRCGTCGSYLYKGTKFNSRKEDAVGDAYLGIQIIRFYFKCSNCSAEITFLTDPQNSDYAVESGASRNFEPWRAVAVAEEGDRKKRKAEEMGDAMKSLENSTADSKREMDILAALDELKSMKSRRATVTADAMLEALQQREEEEHKESKMEEKEAAYVRAVFLQGKTNTRRRIDDQDLEFDSVGTSSRPLKRRRDKLQVSSATESSANKTEFSITKKKSNKTETETEEDAQDASNLLQLFQQYGSSDSEN